MTHETEAPPDPAHGDGGAAGHGAATKADEAFEATGGGPAIGAGGPGSGHDSDALGEATPIGA